ncbi:MAG: coniferyl aldehyde dehydrogenase [Endozoicomonas sp.]
MTESVLERTEAAKPAATAADNRETGMEQLLIRQRKAFLNNPSPSADERRGWLKMLNKALLDNKQALIQALDEDFGGRAHNDTLLAEFMPSLEGIKYSSRNLKKWMKPVKRHVSATLQPASAKVMYQPLGVVGIVVPWNYPLFLACGPLVTALAAGNRAMIKMSEFTPKTSALFQKIIGDTFPEDLVTVITGEAEVAAEFTQLPFDHILFTGSTNVGRHVMTAAAKNLTPVTLELGGKSPVIVDSDFPIKEVAERICYGKSMNAGQTCVAPDYVLIKKDQREAFVKAYLKAFQTMYPTVNGNSEYTAIVNDRQHQRLLAHIEDAKIKGAEIVTPGDAEITDGSRRLPPHLVLNASDDMTVMQEEIFGPLLPIIEVDSIDQAIDYVRDRPSPLALYYFGQDKATQDKVLAQTHSGGACINETLFHVVVDDIPFGGVGDSGMGHYHGHEGFLTLSKAKAVLSKGKFNGARLVFPPYNTWFKKKVMQFISGG